MERSRILINIHYLEIGGAESSLIGLLQALDAKRVDVDLFLNDHRGEMMAYIPEWVNLLPPDRTYTMIERPIKEILRAGYVHIAFARLWAKIRFWFYLRKKHPIDGSAIFGYVSKYVTPLLPSLKHFGEYDLAISFVTPHNIVLDKVQAKKKICWIHTDYTNIDVDTALELPIWGGYDCIVSISKSVTQSFCQVFPSLHNKIIEIENILSPGLIYQQADTDAQLIDMAKVENGYTLLTIGRYCAAKKMEEIPVICRMLIEKGLLVKWYIIGYGGSDEYIRKAIADEGMEEHVILLGKRANPYPYISACDWYIQPSRYEGKSVVVTEAKILKIPVIITNYPTSASQMQDGVDGVIVPMPVKECADAIAAILTDNDLKNKIIDFLTAHDYSCTSEIEKIYSLLSDTEETANPLS